jgi:quercetin dioxygenase-like cupin family protein
METTIQGVSSDADGDSWKRAAQRALHPSGRTVGIDILSAIASGLAAVTVPWEVADGDPSTERRYQRVLATPEYEAWVICWPRGGSLDLHDHGGSAGAFSVVSGQLDEATIEGGAMVARTYSAGDTASFGPSRVHAVANRGTGVATSVHVYSPPLSTMVYYENDDEGRLVAVAEDARAWADSR